MTQRLSCVLLLLLLLFTHQASSSTPPTRLPSTYYDNTDKNRKHTPSNSATDGSGSNKKIPPRSQPSAVTFLYELYEHEIYNPSTDSWTSRRFTQSPITGGGGRDSTSLEPQSCTPPRNYLFDGEWKIDMAGETRDGFGWEYYVGRYDGLGRRRRRWVRELRRISSGSNVILNKSKSTSGKKRKSIQKKTQQKKSVTQDVNVFQAIQQQYNFKGFGWSFYKSLLFMRSFGAAIRIPLSSNLDFYDAHKAWPYISTSTYFGYPWVIATFFNASMPVEAIKYIIGGAVWKVQWSLAVLSALTRSIVEAIVWTLLSPWRLWANAIQAFRELTGRVDTEKQDKKIADSLISHINNENKETSEMIDSVDIKMESFIDMNNTTDSNSPTEVISSTNAVMESPRGGATQGSLRKKHLTIFGNEVPTFHRTNSIEYSSTIQERIGICVSWRVSKERGYEYRCNFFFTCLPTILFWQQLGEERNRRLHAMRQFRAKLFGSDELTRNSASSESSKSITKRSSKNSVFSSFFSEHYSSVGFSSGWPLPMDPFFSLNLLLSMSGFYYGWLLKYIGSLFSVSKRVETAKANKLISTKEADEISDAVKEEMNEDEVEEDLVLGSTNSIEVEVSDSEEEKKTPVKSE